MPAKIEMVSGTGAALLENWPGGTMKVRVTDAAGKGVANVKVDWSVVSGEAANISSPGLPTDLTDTDGLAARVVRGVPFQAAMPFGKTVLRATASVGSVDFKTVTVHQSSIGPVPPHIYVKEPQGKDLGTVKAGSTIPAAIQIQVTVQAGNFTGTALPDAAVRIVDDVDHDKLGAVGCAGGFALSDTNGTATCDLKVGTQLGDHWVAIWGGEQSLFGGYHVKIVP